MITACAAAVLMMSACASASTPTFPQGMEDAMQACGAIFAADRLIQEKAEPDAVWRVLDAAETAANNAANNNIDFEQLALMTRTFITQLESGSPDSMLSLVAVEMECDDITGTGSG